MRNVIFTIAVATAMFFELWSVVVAQESGTPKGHVADEASNGNARVELERLETVWNEAHTAGDVHALDKLWSEDITVVVPRMAPLRKPEMLEMWKKSPVKFETYSSDGIDVRDYGDSAVVTGRIHRKRDFGGRKAEENWQFTKMYHRFDAGWRVIAFHASTMPE